MERSWRRKAGGQGVQKGLRPVSALAFIITAIAVLREGSETVLFLYGIAADGTADSNSMLGGGALGIAAASVLGWLLYAGLLRVPVKHVFKVTGATMLLLTAGLAAQAAAFLVQSGYLPALGYDVWDTTPFLAQDHPIGTLLHILIGYVARPEGIQVLVYAATLLIILSSSALVRRARRLAVAKGEPASPLTGAPPSILLAPSEGSPRFARGLV